MEEIVSWLAPAATTLAALITASNLGSRITGYGFAIFTVGSLAWLAQGYFTGQSNLLWQNAILTALNLFGVWRWLGVRVKIEEGGRAAQEESHDTPGEALFPSSLIGRGRLTASDGAELGRTVDAMIGCSSGRLSYLVVAEGGVAGVGETLRRLEWKEVSVEEDRFRVPISPQRFRSLPLLDKDAWPG
jgi:hypothetical protein